MIIKKAFPLLLHGPPYFNRQKAGSLNVTE